MSHDTRRVDHVWNEQIRERKPVSFKRDGSTQTIVYELNPGEGILTHVHEWDHLTRIETGTVVVYESDKGFHEERGPTDLIMREGIVHAFKALTPSKIINTTDMSQPNFRLLREEEARRHGQHGADGADGR